MEKIGLQFEIQTNNTTRELAEVELELQRISAALKEAKKQNDGSTYEKLRTEQLQLQSTSAELRKEFKRQLKEFKASELPTDSIEALQLKYARLSQELRKISTSDPNFTKRSREAKELNDRLKQLEGSLGDTRRNVGNYQEAVEGALSSVNDAIGGNISALAAGLGVNGLVVAGIDLVADGLQIIRDLSKEIVNLEGALKRVTDLEGDALDSSLTRVQALSQTFGVETDQIIEAANAASKGFGTTFLDALSAVEVGFLSGANANGELIDSFKEYPSVLDNAGVELDDFVKLLTQQARGGVFSDKLIDTIKEADLSLKELTKTQLDALAPLGGDFVDQLAEGLKAGEITTIEAIESIALRANDLGLDLQEFQVITADVFKGAGEDAGGFGKVFKNISDGLQLEYSDLVDETDRLTIAQQNQIKANEEFAAAQLELSRLLGGLGTSTETLGKQVQTFALETLNFLITRFKQAFEIIRPLINAVGDLFRSLGVLNVEGKASEATLKVINFIAKSLESSFRGAVFVLTKVVEQITKVNNGVKNAAAFLGIIKRQQSDAAKETTKANKDIEKGVSELQKQFDSLSKATKKNKEATTETKEATTELSKELETLSKVSNQVQKTGLAALEARLADLNTKLAGAETKEAFAAYTTQIEELEDKIAKTSARFQRFSDLQKGLLTIPVAIESRFDSDLPGAVEQVISLTGIEESAEVSRAREEARLIESIKKDSEGKITQQQEEQQEQRLENEKEYYRSRAEIFGSASEELGQALASIATDSEATLADFGRAVLTIALRTAEQVVQLSIAEMYAKQLRDGLIGIGKAALLQGLITGFTSAIFATIRSSIQEFAEGGIVDGPANAPRTPQGDNMLIYASAGEMVLTKKQQAKAEQIAGQDIWSTIGVPGFSRNATAGAMLVSPSSQVANTLHITDEQVVKIAQTVARETAQSVARETAQSVGNVMQESSEREIRLKRMYKSLAK